MDKYNISQLPVIEDGHAVGSITETALLEVGEEPDETTVAEHQSAPFPEVPVTERRETVRNLLRQNRAVLLTQAESSELPTIVGPYVGIVTASDFRL